MKAAWGRAAPCITGVDGLEIGCRPAHIRLVGALIVAGVLIIFTVVAVTALVGPPLARVWRRRRITRRPFPAAWRDIVRRRVPAWRELPAAQQLQLKKHIQVLT